MRGDASRYGAAWASGADSSAGRLSGAREIVSARVLERAFEDARCMDGFLGRPSADPTRARLRS